MFGNGPEGNNPDEIPEYPLEPVDEPGSDIEPYTAPEIPPHEALIISEEMGDASDTQEATFIVPPLGEMSPDAQEAWLLAAALTTAENGRPEASLNARVAASKLLPPGDTMFSDLHDEVQQMDRNRIDRTLTMAELSRRPYIGAHEAWASAFDAARQLGRIAGVHENPHLLELIVDGQTDPLRFADVKWAAQNMVQDRWANPDIPGNADTIPYVQARIRKAVIKREIAVGLVASAAATFATMPRDRTAKHRDEAAVYLTEAVAQTQTDDSTALATHSLAEITNDHMRTWGQIKIAKHNPQYANETWQGIEHKLERDWGFFTTQQRQAVVRDIAGTGDLYLAGAYANKIADRFSTADERRVQTESVIEIAYQQAEVQPYNGIHTLRNARSAAAQRLAEVVEGVGEVGGTIPLTAKQHAFNSLRAEYTDRVNMLTAHEIAAQVHLDPDAAVSAMRNATFIGTQPGVYKSRVRRVVAEQLARVGRIEQAAAIAAEIPDDSDSDAQKSQAFTAIARSVRQQRNAIGQ